MAKVGTFENKKVHKHLHLSPLGPRRRRLAVRSGTSKGSTISQYGCSTFEALVTEAQQKEERALNTVLECKLGQAQSGFIRGRPCTYCVLIIYPLVEKHREFNVETLITILDYEEACDKVIRNKLCQIMTDKGFP